MYGPKRARPCPMCTALLSCLNGNADHIRQRIALAVVGLSPIERQVAFKVERGWKNLPMYADVNGKFTKDYHGISDDGTDTAAYNVFTRRNGTIRHFWGAELGFESADPGKDPATEPDLMVLWNVLCRDRCVFGIGPVTASALAASVADPAMFTSGREFSAFLGLVPKQNSSGGKVKLGGISKMGDRYLRHLLVSGAAALLSHAKTRRGPWTSGRRPSWRKISRSSWSRWPWPTRWLASPGPS
jgi:hypothetical protein